MKKSTDTLTLPNLAPEQRISQAERNPGTRSLLTWYCLAFCLCILFMVAPLARMAGTTLQYKLPTSALIVLPGAWIPVQLGVFGSGRNAEMATHLLFFFAFLALAFVIYASAARALTGERDITRTTLRWIWLTALICGTVFVLTPAMLSHDVFAYSSYGRIQVVYHANPYFTPFANFTHDPFYAFDDWKRTPSAYGPVWLLISGLVAFFCGGQPLNALLTYQILGLTFHMFNIFLVVKTLQTLQRSERIVLLGALLYGWNPLVLIESCLGGHNDSLLITLLLLSLWLLARAEQRGQSGKFQLRGYLLPLFTITLAILVKFSAGPLLLFFLVLVARRAFLASATETSRERWKAAIQTFCIGGLLSGAIIILFYGPYWIGWSLKDIITSFTNTPASYSADGSILRALQEMVKIHSQPTTGWEGALFKIFLNRSLWNLINMLVFVPVLLLGIRWVWYVPSTRTVALATLAGLGAILLFTPWFFPWYVTWLVALAVVCLPIRQERWSRAVIGSSLVFSASAFFIYLYARNIPPIGGWIGLACLTTILPPLVAFVILLRLPTRSSRLVGNDH